MKFAGVILLLGFCTYFTETINLPVNICAAAAAEEMAAMPCAKMMNAKCGMCHKEKKPGRSEKGCTKNSNICTNCPLCYNLMTANYKSIPTIITIVKAICVLHEVDLVPGYTSAQWKPPNTA